MAVDILSMVFKLDTRDVARGNRDLDNLRNSANGASGATDKLASSFLGMSKSYVSSLVGVASLVTLYKKVITESRNFEAEQGQLAAVIKSTGMAAGFSTQQLNKMADSFAKSTSFSAGEINRAQTRLLSYSGIVGETFPQAMQTAIDMAARMNMSLEQAAETMGKAMDIPSQGLTALSRQGFRFTEEQEALVKVFEKTGRVAEAHKIIMDTVNSSYKGAAEALNTGLNKATADSTKAFQDFATVLGNTSIAQNTAIVVFTTLTNVLKELQRIIEQDLNRVIHTITFAINALAIVLTIKLVPSIIATSVAFITATQQSIAYQLALARMAGVSTTAAVATGALTIATRALLSPIGLIVTALGVAGLAWFNYGEKAESATEKTAKSVESAKEKVEALRGQLTALSDANPIQEELSQAAKNYADALASSVTIININGDAVKTNTEAVGLAKKQLDSVAKSYKEAQSIIDEQTNKLTKETKATSNAAAQLKALEDAEKSYQRILENRKSAMLEIADLQKVNGLLKDGLDIEEAQFRVASERKGLLPAQIEALLTQKNIQDDIAVAEVERQSRLQFFIKTQQKAYDDEVQRIKEITKLQQEKANENFKQAQDAQKEIDNANQRMAENLNRSLTDALLRGFESGLSFAENFRRTLRNMFSTLVLQPIISFALQPITNAATGLMTELLGSNTASGSTLGGIGNLFSESGSIFSAITSGFDAANIALEQGIQRFGTFITQFGSVGNKLGGVISQFSSGISKALPFLDAGIKLITGDVKGAAFSGVGAAIGFKFGGPVGAGIGSALGNMLGGILGGKEQPPRTVTELPDVAEVFNQQLSALLKSFSKAGEVTSTASFKGRAGGSGYGGFSGMVEDMAISDSIRYKDAFDDKSLQAFITRTLTETITRAIKSTDIDQAFKDLFDGITDREDMGKTIQAVIALNQNNQQLTDTLGITATQVALLANESDIAGDNLVTLVNTLTGISTELLTTGDALVAIKTAIDGAFVALSGSEVPANLKAFDEALKALDKTTAEGRQDFLGLVAIRETFAKFENAIASLRGNVRSALFSISDDGERLAMMQEDLAKQFADVNLQVPETVEKFKELISTVDFTTAAGINLASVMPALANAFVQTQDAAESARIALEKQAESARIALENIARTQMQQIINSANEANRIAQDNLQVANDNADIARDNLMNSFDAERTRLQGIIDSVGSLRENLATAFTAEKGRLQLIIDNVDTFKNALRQAFNTQASGLQDTINRFKNFGNSIREFRKGLIQSSSIINNSVDFNRARLIETVALAKAGDVSAMDELTSVAGSFLQSSQNYSRDFNEYQADFLEVNKILTDVENSAFSTASVADLQLMALKTQVKSLISIGDTIESVDEAIANLNKAQAEANIAQLEIKRLNILQTAFLGTSNEALLSVDDSLIQLVLAESLAMQAQDELNNLNNLQVSLLGQINQSVLSVTAAIAGLNFARQEQSTAQKAASITQTNVNNLQEQNNQKIDTPESIYREYLGREADPAGLAFWQKEFGAEVDTQELRTFQQAVRENQALGFEQTNEAKAFASLKFANGASFTNGIVSRPTTFNTGMMGEAGSEAIMPLSNIGGRLGVTSNNSEMVAQLKAISEKITRLEAVQVATAQNTGKVAKIIERADNGDSINVTVTA